jgi:hypothetical protein
MKRRDFLTKSAAAIVAVPAVAVAGAELAAPEPEQDDRNTDFDLFNIYQTGWTPRVTPNKPPPFLLAGPGHTRLVDSEEFERIKAGNDPAWTTVPPTPSDEA